MKTVITKSELKHLKLLEVEKRFMKERQYNGCAQCWIKYLRPVFYTYYIHSSDFPGAIEQYIFLRCYVRFDKCCHTVSALSESIIRRMDGWIS